MNTILWVLQAILSIKLLSTAFSHGLRHGQEEMTQAIRAMGPIARSLLIAIAVLTFLGSAGLVAPAAISLPRWVTPLTAALLAGWMLVSIAFHLNCREEANVIVSIVLFAIAAAVAYGRWALSPL